MSAITQANIKIDQGGDFETTFYLLDQNSDPLDLSNYAFFGQIRKTHASSKFWCFDIDPEYAGNGEIIVRFPSSRSIDIRPGLYQYDIYGKLGAEDFDWPDDFVRAYKLVEGTVYIAPGITKFGTFVDDPDFIAPVPLRHNPDVDSSCLEDGSVIVYSEDKDIFETTIDLDSQNIEGGNY